MKIRLLLTIAVLATATIETFAQYTADALRFSQTQSGSTARFKAIGAQIGVGGDLSSVGSNPAGIGLFTKSDFSFTPEFNTINANASFLNANSIGQKDQLTIGHAAVVWNQKLSKPKGSDLGKGWISFNYGIGYNRTKSYGDNFLFSGTNPKNSIADYYAELATSNFGAPNTLSRGSLERMAYDNYVIGYDNFDGTYFPETDVNNKQTKNDIRTGSQSEINFAFGANYSNQFYIGASLGITSLRYSTDAVYRETGYNVTEDNNYDLSFRQAQSTRGTGINARLGAIYRPNKTLRLGATLETPTWSSINDRYSEGLDTKYGRNRVDSSFVNDDSVYDFSYRLRTPLKLSGGVGVFFNKNGFISADIDYVDYSTINLSSYENAIDSDVIVDNNREILRTYKSAINFRLGTELKFNNIMLRAGYGLQGNPYQEKMDDNGRVLTNFKEQFKIQTYSGGLGYRINDVYFDLTYQQISYNTQISPYSLNDATNPVANIDNKRNNIFLTIGKRF
jgi:hypothetical protein